MKRVTVLAGLVLLAGASLPAAGQESTAAGQDSAAAPPYFLLIDSTIATEDAGDWAAAVAVTARAHAKHPKGNLFATYRLLTGGPDETARVLFPFNKMADLDGWVSNRQVLFEAIGKERGQVVLDDLELERDSTERIVAYSRKLSRPPQEVRAAKYLWVVEVQVEPGRMVEYSALALRVKKAYEQSSQGRNWLVYGNAVGGDRSELTYLYGVDALAELDDWPSGREVLAAAYGPEEAARLAAALESMTSTRKSLWTLEGELSQLEGE